MQNIEIEESRALAINVFTNEGYILYYISTYTCMINIILLSAISFINEILSPGLSSTFTTTTTNDIIKNISGKLINANFEPLNQNEEVTSKAFMCVLYL